MVKIKNKTEMEEKEYLHYVIDNALFLNVSHDYENAIGSYSDITLNLIDTKSLTHPYSTRVDNGRVLFTVEKEVEITEDTLIPKLLVKWSYDGTAKEYHNSKINDFVPGYAEAMYIVNDDLTMTLIWRDGKLV